MASTKTATVKEKSGGGALLPKELLEADGFLAMRVLLKAVSIITIGLIVLSEPFFLIPGIFLVGIGMTYLYLVGYECSQFSFFKSVSANYFTRALTWAPLLTSIEGDWVGLMLARLAPIVIMATLSFYMGFARFVVAFLKYWLLPLLIVHINIKNGSYGENFNKAVSVLFPELAGDGKLVNILGQVPFYKLDRALQVLNVNVADARDNVGGIFSLFAFPSNYCISEMLFWNKRDILIEISLALAAVMLPLQYYNYMPPASMAFPLLLLILGFTKNSKATKALGRTMKNTLLNSLRSAFPESWGTREPHWFNIFYLGFVHIWGLLALFFAVPVATWGSLFVSLFFFHVVFGFGITVGAHRLWSHRSYEASLPVRIVLAFLATGANQGTIWHWVRDHRIHHRYSDTEKDPHNANNGFWYSHFGWLMVKKSPEVVQAGIDMDMSDMDADPVIRFQKKYYPILALLISFLFPAAVVMYLFDEHWLVALSLSYLRYVIVLNGTWCVNSVAHAFGYRPYRPDQPPAENLFVSLIAVGEGWHNYHHAYPFDYATSEYGILGQWNPSKFVIDVLAMLGLVWNRKSAKRLAEKARAQNGWMNQSEVSKVY
jgi:stearoyl-CoA desaturase (delta-9 desaturase)